MSSLDATYLAYVLLALPLIAGATWSLHRHSAALLFDLVDADEMVIAAISRLVTAAHVLLAAAAAVCLAPSATDAHGGPASALLSSLGGLLTLLAILHLGVLALYFSAKRRRADRAFGAPAQPTSTSRVHPMFIPGATPPTVPMPPPVFHAPRMTTPPGVSVDHPVWTYPPPTGPRLAPTVEPPFPPPWCTPLR